MFFKKKKTKADRDKTTHNNAMHNEAIPPSSDKTTDKPTDKPTRNQRKKNNPTKQPDLKKQPMLIKLFYLCFYSGVALFAVLCFGLWLYAIELDKEYNLSEDAFAGSLWELPSRVYARPLDLYHSRDLKLANLVKELGYLGYTADPAVRTAGTYHIDGNEILIHKRAFGFWDEIEPEQLIRVRITDDKITDLIDMDTLATIPITRIEPLLIGSIYPTHGQDRRLISLDETPEILIDTLIATEDRRFWSHFGIDPKGIMRAVFEAVKNRQASQGASTLTQQYIKNHYLTSERRISRKVKEAIMAIILEKNYSKQQILEGYLNEIYLGQDGKRAIHGFGLAAEHYFGKPLSELGVHQIAMLIGLVREPGRANPYRNPEYAQKRREIILDVMVGQNLLAENEATLAKSLPLDILERTKRRETDRYYSFLQVVYREIDEQYNNQQLASGLNIFTTLDPIIQEEAEKSIAEGLDALEERHGMEQNFLQAASVIVDSITAEVVAIVGDRNNETRGFNRAIQAKRQPGSLLKPVVYLAALEYPERYNLATPIDDSPLTYQTGDYTWEPKNYTGKNQNNVLLIDGLVHSHNIPTARIALDIGINDIIGRLQDLGARPGLPEFPSIVLGTVAMSPFEVAQIYETLANGGYRMPLRVISSITDAYDQPIRRFPMESVKVIYEAPHYLIIKAMQETVTRGTAVRLADKIPQELNIAGKTGTTDDYRDSWFAGFSGNYLNVVWVGNDDNKQMRLSGSSGAMRVWMDVMKDLPLKPLNITAPDGIESIEVDLSNGLRMTSDCRDSRKSATLPFLFGSEPTTYTSCYRPPEPQNDFDDEFFTEGFDYPTQSTPNLNQSQGNSWYNQPQNETQQNPNNNQQNRRQTQQNSENSFRGRGGFND
ncbi:penicillin-binding protein 1B [Ostreibacterium oceani]|uniref:Penicillin-binding protein 1B n=1 Tax=Ostreibacterium oceani TaxID=2654998 RepID=A0A6N7ESI7_9GAMM|nr:penicillin-binding protein 1B [Ostreibacterium oceani]MPV85462.1 penicillin-binding protein 1B [Ostreibacterium oceani]